MRLAWTSADASPVQGFGMTGYGAAVKRRLVAVQRHPDLPWWRWTRFPATGRGSIHRSVAR
jgi:hypothetical protein